MATIIEMSILYFAIGSSEARSNKNNIGEFYRKRFKKEQACRRLSCEGFWPQAGLRKDSDNYSLSQSYG